MLNDINSNINNNLIGLGATLLGNTQNVAAVSTSLKNAYVANSKESGLIDQGQISEEAIKKYEAEKEIAYYKSILSQMLESDEPKSDNISSLMKQVQDGKYDVNNSDLAKSMLSNPDLTDLLF